MLELQAAAAEKKLAPLPALELPTPAERAIMDMPDPVDAPEAPSWVAGASSGISSTDTVGAASGASPAELNAMFENAAEMMKGKLSSGDISPGLTHVAESQRHCCLMERGM